MISQAIDRIAELANRGRKPEFVEIGGRCYSNIDLKPVMESEPKPLFVTTLSALVEYIAANPDALTGYFINVVDPGLVELKSDLTKQFQQRPTYMKVTLLTDSFKFGQWFDVEMFIVNLQSHFQPNEDLKAILSILGNLKDENVRSISDDGVTQTVTARTGIARVGDVTVPNPVTLFPYRTFPEIEQPFSQFVFRMRQGKEKPDCALFEAGGGLWRILAVQRIRDWLQERLPEALILA